MTDGSNLFQSSVRLQKVRIRPETAHERSGMDGKTVLITGATGGSGLEADVELAGRGARMFLVGRDPGRTAAAVAQVKARSGSGDVSSFLCDFSSQGSIRALAGEIRDKLDRLDVLINN